MKYFYLSFVVNGAFAGATIIYADSPQGAIYRTWQCGLNPGGEVAFCVIPDADLAKPEYQLCIGRLATRDELIGTGEFARVGDLRR